jgi:putative sigma-54 modulation protein
MRDHKQRQSVRHPEIEEPAEPEKRSPRVHRSKNYSVRPLALEDALLELESSGKELLVYRDVDSERLNVVYRRQDGDFGLVDPEF